VIHQRTHPNLDVPGCFGCRISGISFGRVPGGARQGSGFDVQALESQIGSLEAAEHYTREATEGFGHLRWSGGRAYAKDRKTGDYNALSESEMTKVMYGSARSEETKRSFFPSKGPKSV